MTPEDGIGQEDVDAAYDEGYDAGADSGDANGDGTLDVLDMVMFIDIILNP